MFVASFSLVFPSLQWSKPERNLSQPRPAMINPYQPPAAPENPGGSSETVLHDAPLVAHFRWTEKMQRYALAKYMLSRCAARITLLSIGMIAMTILMAILMVLEWPISFQGIPFLLPIIGVMLVTAILYVWLIATAKRSTLTRLAENGLLPGAQITLEIRPGKIQCQTLSPTGAHHSFEQPTQRPAYMNTGRGLLIITDLDSIFFVPRKADFEGWSYREFRAAARRTWQA